MWPRRNTVGVSEIEKHGGKEALRLEGDASGETTWRNMCDKGLAGASRLGSQVTNHCFRMSLGVWRAARFHFL